MDRFYVEIGGRMRALRKALRMTQAQVAESAGIDASFYGQIERGKNVPSLKTFVAIAAALRTGPAELLSAAGPGSYAKTMESLMGDLKPDKRRLVLGVVSDMVSRLKK